MSKFIWSRNKCLSWCAFRRDFIIVAISITILEKYKLKDNIHIVSASLSEEFFGLLFKSLRVIWLVYKIQVLWCDVELHSLAVYFCAVLLKVRRIYKIVYYSCLFTLWLTSLQGHPISTVKIWLQMHMC